MIEKIYKLFERLAGIGSHCALTRWSISCIDSCCNSNGSKGGRRPLYTQRELRLKGRTRRRNGWCGNININDIKT